MVGYGGNALFCQASCLINHRPYDCRRWRWNASIVAEALSWQGQDYYAHGLGAFITHASIQGRTADLLVGIMVMCGYVLLINRLVWLPWYNHAISHQRTAGNEAV